MSERLAMVREYCRVTGSSLRDACNHVDEKLGLVNSKETQYQIQKERDKLQIINAELLEALRAIVQHCEGYQNKAAILSAHRARAAIAKATRAI